VIPLSLAEVAMPEAVVLGSGDTGITNIAEDSRRVEPGDLFVALKGPNNDAHAYVPTAFERGAPRRPRRR